MSKLSLSVAVRDYDRTRALFDGSVQIDGVDPVLMSLSPEEIFFRAFRHTEFDICELSLSSFTVKVAQGDCAYVGVPVFVSRAFRHTSIYVRSDRIKTPQDLKGKTVGLPEYQLTANVWARALLQDDFGVKPSDIRWMRGGMEEPGRREKIAIKLPADVRCEDIGETQTLSRMLAEGDIDAIIGPRMPSCFAQKAPNVGWLFPDPIAAASDYFKRTRIFPIMHLVGVRKTLVAAHPWLPATILKAFEQAKRVGLERLADTSSTKVTLPFVEEQLQRARELMGEDFWPYGVAPNRHVIETFLRHHHAQGLSGRLVAIEDMFHPSTFETVKL
jgi:4,5-dihydroxyphthalate decarboxylase